MLLDLILVFYGYLSLSFGWLFYLVVFTSLGIAIYTAFRSRDIYQTAERFIKSITLLGIGDLLLSTVVSVFLTVKWLIHLSG